jgi:hypothetical protein
MAHYMAPTLGQARRLCQPGAFGQARVQGQHADLIDTMPACYAQAPWIEIEAKSKEDALDGLRPWLKSIGETVRIDEKWLQTRPYGATCKRFCRRSLHSFIKFFAE